MSRLVPVLFNTPMTQAIIDDRKTHTRRIIKGIDDRKLVGNYLEEFKFANVEEIRSGTAYKNVVWIKSKYKPGDILYVRETWCKGRVEIEDTTDGYEGKAYISQCVDENDIIFKEQAIREDVDISETKWKPSIFMPKEAARIFLKVTNVTVKRLNNMTPYDASQEGIIPDDKGCNFKLMEDFKDLWDSTVNKKDIDKYSWDSNPYVFDIEFEKISKEEAYGLCEIS